MEKHWLMIRDQMCHLLKPHTAITSQQVPNDEFRWITKLWGDSIEFWFSPEAWCDLLGQQQ
jgi:hypothetical protein